MVEHSLSINKGYPKHLCPRGTHTGLCLTILVASGCNAVLGYESQYTEGPTSSDAALDSITTDSGFDSGSNPDSSVDASLDSIVDSTIDTEIESPLDAIVDTGIDSTVDSGSQCTPGSKQCKGLYPQTCSSQGFWNMEGKCPYLCSSGKCAGSCVPGNSDCVGLIPRNCDENGSWQVASACKNQACKNGICLGICEPGAKQCSGNLLQTCQSLGQWNLGTSCSGTTPLCSAGQCVAAATSGQSCVGLASTCGPGNSSNCCASSVLPAGMYYRSNDDSYPAMLNEFRLDNYECTVGRFRKFVGAYSRTMTAPGAGKNPNNPSDTGWNTTWNGYLPLNASALTSSGGVQCDSAYQTWTPTPGANENLPINCITWFEAYAFCTWDGGRLATEAEWNYAAAGGSEQRKYPWGSLEPGSDTNLAVHGCYLNGMGTCSSVTNIAPVGAVTAGDGKWGQSDLAGNVWEWARDAYDSQYIQTCVNCANFDEQSAANRVTRGGAFDSSVSNLATAKRWRSPPTSRDNNLGFRCARTP